MALARYLTLAGSLLLAHGTALAQSFDQTWVEPTPDPASTPSTTTANDSYPVDTEQRPPSSVEVYQPPPRYQRPKKKLGPLATTERWGGGIRLTGLSGIGALPGVNYGGEVAGLVRRDEMFVELALGSWRPEDEYNVQTPEDSVALKLDVWTVRAGWASMDMPLRAWILGEVGEVAGTPGMIHMPGVVPRMVMGETPTERRWAAIGGGLGVAWPLTIQARLVGNFELAIPVAHDKLMLDRGGAYQPDPLSARYSVGLEVGWR
jgi:hypothetical protein